MDFRAIIFYLALLLIVGAVAELFVRMKGIGQHQEKVRGVIVVRKPRLAPPIALLIAAIIAAIATIPR